jgi:hypothetical protein
VRSPWLFKRAKELCAELQQPRAVLALALSLLVWVGLVWLYRPLVAIPLALYAAAGLQACGRLAIAWGASVSCRLPQPSLPWTPIPCYSWSDRARIGLFFLPRASAYLTVWRGLRVARALIQAAHKPRPSSSTPRPAAKNAVKAVLALLLRVGVRLYPLTREAAFLTCLGVPSWFASVLWGFATTLVGGLWAQPWGKKRCLVWPTLVWNCLLGTADLCLYRRRNNYEALLDTACISYDGKQ